MVKKLRINEDINNDLDQEIRMTIRFTSHSNDYTVIPALNNLSLEELLKLIITENVSTEFCYLEMTNGGRYAINYEKDIGFCWDVKRTDFPGIKYSALLSINDTQNVYMRLSEVCGFMNTLTIRVREMRRGYNL